MKRTWIALHTGPELANRGMKSSDMGGQSQLAILAAYHSTNHVTLVGNGACGNLNHFDFDWSRPQNTGAEGHRIGTILGAAVFQAYKNLKPVAAGPLRAKSEIVELGLAIKKRPPFPHTFVVELANENLGYIPDRRSYAEGSYEPESARCAAGSGEKLVEVAVALLAELHQ